MSGLYMLEDDRKTYDTYYYMVSAESLAQARDEIHNHLKREYNAKYYSGLISTREVKEVVGVLEIAQSSD